MQEFWFCESCKSMNRGSVDRCYRCGSARSTATLKAVTQRAPGVVLTPELDDEHREIAWLLMARHDYTSAWELGYISAATLLVVSLAIPMLLLFEIALVATGKMPLDETGPAAVLRLLWTGLGIAYLVAIVIHSVFLGLTSMNLPALGSGNPRFDPLRAGLWWIESALWAVRGGLAFTIPCFLAMVGLFLGGPIFGLITGGVWFWLALQVLGDPVACLAKPRRLIEDLWQRLAGPGDADARIVSIWAMAWGVSRGFSYAVSGLIYLTLIVVVLLSFLGERIGANLGLIGEKGDATSALLLVGFVIAVQVLAEAIASLLLVRITVELCRRQRKREAWVTSGMPAYLSETLPVSRPEAGPGSGPAQARVQSAAVGVAAGEVEVDPARAEAPPAQAPPAEAPPAEAPPAEAPPAEAPPAEAGSTVDDVGEPGEAESLAADGSPEEADEVAVEPSLRTPRWVRNHITPRPESPPDEPGASGHPEVVETSSSGPLDDAQPAGPSQFMSLFARVVSERQAGRGQVAESKSAPEASPEVGPEVAPETSPPAPIDAARTPKSKRRVRDWPEGL